MMDECSWRQVPTMLMACQTHVPPRDIAQDRILGDISDAKKQSFVRSYEARVTLGIIAVQSCDTKGNVLGLTWQHMAAVKIKFVFGSVKFSFNKHLEASIFRPTYSNCDGICVASAFNNFMFIETIPSTG